jgi:hypothetical protein
MEKCRICNTDVTMKGRTLKTGTYHRECLSMQQKGLLRTGNHPKPMDSTGKPCAGCNELIDGSHAHRQGRPYHRECLFVSR